MTKHSESTHAKNLTNFAALIEVLRSFGTVYQPANAQLEISRLQALLLQAQEAQALFNQRKSAYSDAVDKQQLAFADVTGLTTRVGNALKASGTSAKSLETFNTVARKVKGRRATPLKTAARPAANAAGQEQPAALAGKVSAAQTGYANRIDNFALLIETLKTDTLYQPNEQQLKVAGLDEKLAAMRQSYQEAAAGMADLQQARDQRNQWLYAPEQGMIAVVSSIKAYVKSIFPVNTAQYKHVAALSFKAQH